MSLQFMRNLRSNLRKEVVKSDGAAIIGGILPMAVGTVLNLSGWPGWFASYGSVYIIAKGLGHENVARGAAAVSAAHLAWTVGAPYIEKYVGRGPWRMGAAQGVGNSLVAMNNNYDQMMDAIPAGESVAQLPSSVHTYPSAELSNSVTRMGNSVTAMNNSVTQMSNSVTQMGNSVTQMSGLRRSAPRIGRR